MNPLNRHPNAGRTAISTAVGAGAVFLLNKYLGMHLNNVDGAVIAGGLGTLWLFLGREGLVGALDTLLHGSGSNLEEKEEDFIDA